MRKLLLILSITSLFFTVTQAQENIEIKESQVSISTIGSKQIRIELIFDLEEGYEHSQSAFGRINQDNLAAQLIIKSKKELNEIKLDALLTASNNGVGFKVEVDEKVIKYIFSGDYDYQFEVKKDLNVLIRNKEQHTDTSRFKLTKTAIIENTKNSLKVSEENKTELVESLKGNIERSENNIDFGVIPSDDSDTEKTEYYASFSYQKGYSFWEDKPIFFSAKGLISTNQDDSLNYISAYPVSYRFTQYDKGGHTKNYDLVAQLGVDGNQSFKNYRIAGNVYLQGLFPNLIDLTMGENRLRLKPVVKIGAKYYKEVENNRSVETNNENGNQLFGELYYFIPIKKNYSLIIDANAFYDFNSTFNTDEKLMHNVSVTFGIDIPKSGFKTIFKYIEGENGISYQYDQLLMIGLMADLFTK